MSKIVVLYNHSNTYGLQKDAAGIQAALGGANTVRTADPLEPPVPSDIAIHLEIPVYVWMPWATKNILMVNPEWFQEAWLPYMRRFDLVIYKDPQSAADAVSKGYVTQSQVRVVPWGCAEPVAPPATKAKGTADTGFVWFLAGSLSKRAYVPTLLPLWRESYPPLRIYSVEPVDCSGLVVPSNVRFEVKDLDPKIRAGLSQFFRGHVGCSAAEGFSYLAAEAEWSGAFTLLNRLNCYVADYTGTPGVHMVDTQEELDAAMQAFTDTDFDVLAPLRRASAAKRWATFQAGFAAAVASLGSISGAQQQLPPILLPEDCPPISVVTLLYNRRKFFELACHSMLMTDYPKDKIEWIIVEDSDDPNEDASDRVVQVGLNAAPLQLAYMPLEKKTPIGQKRNLGIEKAKNDIILMMDDDDHLPETAIRRRVAWLIKSPLPDTKATACTTIACYDLIRGVSAVNTPPWNLPLRKRISEATLTFYKTWWKEQPFDTTSMAEGEGLLKGREQDLLEMPPQQILVAFSHSKNTSGSRQLPKEAKTGCFWGFPKEYLLYIHKLAGVEVEEDA